MRWGGPLYNPSNLDQKKRGACYSNSDFLTTKSRINETCSRGADCGFCSSPSCCAISLLVDVISVSSSREYPEIVADSTYAESSKTCHWASISSTDGAVAVN